MPLFPSDFKKFKHVSTDDKTTTLAHPKGHTITIMHSALGKDMRAQLEALAKAPKNGEKEQPEKLADGGLAGAKRSGELGSAPMVGQQVYDEAHPQIQSGYMAYKPTAAEAVDVRTPEQKARAAQMELESGDAYVRKYDRRDPNHKEGPFYNAEGGLIESIEKKAHEVGDKIKEAVGAGKVEQVHEYNHPKTYDAGTFSQHEPVKKAEGGMIQDPNLIAKADPEKQRTREIYNRLSTNVNPHGMTTPMSSIQFGPNGQLPKQFDTENYIKAEQQQAQEKEQNAAQTAAAQQKAIQDNEVLTRAGLPPVPVPNVPTSPQMTSAPNDTGIATPAQPQAAAPTESKGQNATDLLNKGYKEQIAGINANATAQGNLAQDQMKALQASQDAQHAIQTQYRKDYDALDQERKALMQDVNDGHVDPEKFWTGDKDGNGGHSKIAAAIGMIIAGFNPTNSPNAAIGYLKFQMEQDLAAQKENLASKRGLLSANLQQFGNMKDAMDMTRVMQADMATNQLQQAAAKATSPLAKAAALEAAGKINQEYAPLFQKVAAQTTLNKVSNIANEDPSKIPALLDSVAAVDPEKAKDLRARWVPEVGLASTTEGAKDMKEMKTTLDTVNSSIARLKQIAASTGKSLSPSDRAEADTLRSTLIGRLRVPLTGPGAMSEGERRLLENAIPDVTSMFSLDSSNKKRLDTLQSTITNNYQNMAIANGLRVKPMIQNEIKTMNGQQYQKVNGGWQKIK